MGESVGRGGGRMLLIGAADTCIDDIVNHSETSVRTPGWNVCQGIWRCRSRRTSSGALVPSDNVNSARQMTFSTSRRRSGFCYQEQLSSIVHIEAKPNVRCQHLPPVKFCGSKIFSITPSAPRDIGAKSLMRSGEGSGGPPDHHWTTQTRSKSLCLPV